MDATFIFPLIIIAGSLFAIWLFFREASGIIAIIGHTLSPLPKAEWTWLVEHSHYFRALPPARQKEFSRRVKEVVFEKEWIGRGMDVDREKQIQIAAALVQLTFGLGRLLLLHFRRIMVYPDAYRDRRTSRMHQGDVRPATGTITLSWEHFRSGFADPDDARNLGLHELAHALWIEDRVNNAEQGFFDPELVKAWRTLATAQIKHMRGGGKHFFRAYAATDHAEFFAVAVEYFFERPVAFKEELPELYGLLSRLLKQDPAQRPRMIPSPVAVI